MAPDPKSRRVVFNYADGAATMTRGLADALFGVGWRITLVTPQDKTVTVKSHTRVRVIGQPGTTIGQHTYTYKSYPTMDAEQAQGGQPVIVSLADGSDWTVRVSGRMSSFVAWLGTMVTATGITVRSQRGTLYGPLGIGQSPALP